MPPLTRSLSQWRDAVRRIEQHGFDSISVSEHLTHGWQMEPLSAMLAAAAATDRLRVLSLVLANDFRHPVMLHKAAATIDVVSAGRLELGLGAGWMLDDYVAAGLPFDPPAVRVARLGESIGVLKGLFGPTPFTFKGDHYHISDLQGLPKPVQQPHPPILVGGGAKAILSLAAREADIVGIHCNLQAGTLTPGAAADLGADRVAQKVNWVRQAATAAGRAAESIELQFSMYFCQITRTASQGRAASSSFAELLRADPKLMATSPTVLTGTVDQCIETLCERRERYGFSYLKLGSDVTSVAPIVARLAGT
ncbi:MAG: TIGR03621 family F420-dependent LLM class oxidoreductase [Chloroflexota bacterium]|nr:TIGR03621 family F420-dependent LLM class oxidoreductase [Chloroflexota bacterium]